MMKKILITGASGFTGGYLSEYLISQNKFEIFGTFHSEKSFLNSPVKEKIKFKKIDLIESQSVFNLIRDLKPDYIFHLAAASAPSESFKDPLKTFHTNVDGGINILEAMQKNNLIRSKILIISSCEVYGYVRPEDLPVNEMTELHPSSPYAVSKITQDYLGLQYYLAYKLQCIRARPFNHIGPRQESKFVVSDFSKQIAEIEKGKKEPIIYVGNLEAKRDFTDVRDIVKAYLLLIEKGTPGEAYNIGSGISYSAKEILDILLEFSPSKITIKIDPTKMRPSDMPDIICDNKKITNLTGWKSEIPLRQTLADTLDYWRNIV
jgi:GDP-4-dehydro-6-deoxy-D-mannose reductase